MNNGEILSRRKVGQADGATADLTYEGRSCRPNGALSFLQKPLDTRGWIVSALLILSGVIWHRPDLVLTPQFFGDESLWFGDAYMHGAWQSLLKPQAGYLCLASKLPNLIAVCLPVIFAPTVGCFFAITAQVLMLLYLLSDRLEAVAPLRFRAVLCFFWLALPNCFEVLTLNNTQWILAAGGALVLLSSPPASTLWQVIDIVVIALMGLTGPYCFLLLPIGGVLWFVRRKQWTAILTFIIGCTCLIQAYVLAHWHTVCVPVRVLSGNAVRLLAIQVFSLGMLAMNGTIRSAVIANRAACILIVCAGLIIVLVALIRAPLEFKLFVAFGCMVTAAAAFRLHCDPHWSWEGMLSHEASADRYWYIPRLAFISSIVWLAFDSRWSTTMRSAARVALLLTAIVALISWRHPAPPDFHWPQYAERLESSPAGTTVWIPVNPPGWKFYLQKH